MAKSSSITVKILGDAKGLQKELDDSSSALGSFGSGVGKAAKVAGAAIAGIGLGAIARAPSILAAGGELEALGKKAATVFEGSLGTAQAWARENAGAMGLTADQAVGLGAGIADLLKPMGFTAEAATTMTTNMLDMSGALSAWSGGTKSAAEVTDIITKAMLGETDGLKSLGIAISAADVEAALLAKGQQDLTGSALEQAKAIAIQELIMAKSTDAQKAWADGTMDGMKAQNEAKASMESLKETVIKALYPAFASMLPIATKLAEWLGERLPGVIAWLKDAVGGMVAKFQEWWPTIQTVIAAVVDWLTTVAWPALQLVWDGIVVGVGVMVDWVRTHWDQISSIIEQAIGFVAGAISTGVAIIQTLWATFGDSIVASITVAWELIRGVVEAAINVVRGIINVVMGLIHGDFTQVWDGIKGVFTGAWDFISALVSGAVAAIGIVLSLAWDGIKAAASAAWDAIKGVVMAPIDALVWLLEAQWNAIKGAAQLAWDILYGAAFVAWSAIKGVVMTPINALSGLLQGVWDGIKSSAETAWNAVKSVIEPIINAIKAVVQGLIDIVQAAIDKFNALKNLAIGGIDTSKYMQGASSSGPSFHSGGITDFGSAREGLALLRNNEAVVPLDSPTDARRVMAEAGLTGGRQLVVNNYRRDLTVGDLAQVLAMERLAS